jgi:hypothetical protein
MKNYLLRIAGVLLLIAALLLLVLAPPKENFSFANFYGFLACLVYGFLLVAGYVGTHPIAARLRREAALGSRTRPESLCHVPDKIFLYGGRSWGRVLAVGGCVVLGLALIGFGTVIAWVTPLAASEKILSALPLWIGGLICIWVPVRQLGMFVKIDNQGITARLYFRTVKYDWSEVVALLAREHSLPVIGPTGIVYSVYSQRSKLYFTYSLQGAAQLAAIVPEATGLSWM